MTIDAKEVDIMDGLSSKSVREERLRQIVDEDKIISTRTYNLIMGGVVLYGLVVNVILCNFSSQIASSINPIVLLVGYIVLCIVGLLISRKSHNAIISFLGYNLVCVPLGLVIAVMLQAYGGIGSKPVQMAFLYTIGITIIMILAAIAFPKLFEKLGKALFIALIAIAIVGVISMFIQGMGYIYSLLGAGLFSLYVGYDVYRSQQFAKTADNAVDCAIDIYMDIANLFLFLLRIFGKND